MATSARVAIKISCIFRGANGGRGKASVEWEKTDQGSAVATTRKNPSSTLFTLNVELVDTTPLIWRQIVISGDASFAMLHHVIQAAMGWQDVHLHEFRVGDMRIGVPDAEHDEPDQPVLAGRTGRSSRCCVRHRGRRRAR
ncbi:MAG: plasmid pRiA4b ORF-3 family protein [Candidatus Accumulibacter meliphilus]|uniref:Plasmid pRiA4b ORF-3 family protein n=1 Tax=Candidatus Accumulibacter meliphilus TaxID=2211374 RepID=A0A369XIB8_9PROT|nr:MAG: plasmid pRiA4b ORF-3 family protein [Candidatus Accumulibacter meliphilus]